jgi:putative transcriptional regulator
MSPVPPKGRVHNRIRDLRLAAGLSQQQLADRVGVTRQTINAIEQEKYSPTLQLAFRLAREFEVGFEDVFRFNPR